ncbi:MAG: hypothetical protein ABIA62_04745 [Candidatus Woesearchaeota archaeon]
MKNNNNISIYKSVVWGLAAFTVISWIMSIYSMSDNVLAVIGVLQISSMLGIFVLSILITNAGHHGFGIPFLIISTFFLTIYLFLFLDGMFSFEETVWEPTGYAIKSLIT